MVIIKSYLTILLSVGISSVVIFILGLYWIFKAASPKKASVVTAENLHDLSAIAGDDVITTQLDLARAYIETDRMQLAKTILEGVIEQGNAAQQQEAKQLLNCI